MGGQCNSIFYPLSPVPSLGSGLSHLVPHPVPTFISLPPSLELRLHKGHKSVCNVSSLLALFSGFYLTLPNAAFLSPPSHRDAAPRTVQVSTLPLVLPGSHGHAVIVCKSTWCSRTASQHASMLPKWCRWYCQGWGACFSSDSNSFLRTVFF